MQWQENYEHGTVSTWDGVLRVDLLAALNSGPLGGAVQLGSACQGGRYSLWASVPGSNISGPGEGRLHGFLNVESYAQITSGFQACMVMVAA
eukprot:scaffold401372_cov23-Prasinocladus_malaysianus.AAC.1